MNMKMMNFILIILFVVFSVSAAGAQDKEMASISGTLNGGLRILDVDSGKGRLDYYVYRGDYIVFSFADSAKHNFQVPELDIDETMPKAAGEDPYVKMKKSGTFDFTLGDRKGSIHVLELESASYHELNAYDSNRLIDNVNPLIIDVRTEGEYRQGHIPGAELLPVQIFADNIDQLAEYKDEDILLYCASGNRSTVAAKMLIDAGFTKVYNMRYGIGEWMRDGLPIE